MDFEERAWRAEAEVKDLEAKKNRFRDELIRMATNGCDGTWVGEPFTCLERLDEDSCEEEDLCYPCQCAKFLRGEGE